jgi:hypothetical protein
MYNRYKVRNLFSDMYLLLGDYYINNYYYINKLILLIYHSR